MMHLTSNIIILLIYGILCFREGSLTIIWPRTPLKCVSEPSQQISGKAREGRRGEGDSFIFTLLCNKSEAAATNDNPSCPGVSTSSADDNNPLRVKTRLADERINQKLLTGRTIEQSDQHRWCSVYKHLVR